jgi:tetratricopeptide (TPR) repeat protein
VAPQDRRIAGAIFVAVAVCFAPTLGFGWVYDDHAWLLANSHLRGDGAILRGFGEHLWAHAGGSARAIYWRPLFHAWAASLLALFGESPAPWHAFAILLHAGVTVLAYAAARATVPAGPAAAGAVLFAVHPARAESVGWICGLSDPLVALPLLGLVLAARRGDTGLAAGLFAVALLLKEPALPALVFAPSLLLLQKGPRAGLRPSAMAALPFVLVAGLWFAARSQVLGGAALSFQQVSAAQSLGSGLDLLGRYVLAAVAPPRASVEGGIPLTVLPSAGAWFGLLIVAVAGLALWRRVPERRAELILAAALLAPALRVASLQPEARFQLRYLYLPMALLGPSIAALTLRSLPRRAAWAVLGAAVALSTGMLQRELRPWADDVALWTRATEAAPSSSKAWINLGISLAARGDGAAAGRAFDRAVASEPSRAYAWFQRGLHRRAHGPPAAALGDLATAVALRPRDPWFRYEHGTLLRDLGHSGEARAEFREALALIDAGVEPAFGLRREDVLAAAADLDKRPGGTMISPPDPLAPAAPTLPGGR